VNLTASHTTLYWKEGELPLLLLLLLLQLLHGTDN
jgi:hypothetical protein